MNINSTNATLTFLDYANQYSNIFNAITAMAAVIAIYVSFRAIRISTKDSRKQILAHKIEEIYELVVALSVTYGQLYEVYIILEKAKNDKFNVETRERFFKNYALLQTNLKEKLNLEDLFNKTMRLNVLANTYLLGNIKYDVIGYSQIFNAIIYIIKYNDIKLRQPEFSEELPEPINLYNLSDEINDKLVSVIGYGTKTKGYINYRNTNFKAKIYPKNKLNNL